MIGSPIRNTNRFSKLNLTNKQHCRILHQTECEAFSVFIKTKHCSDIKFWCANLHKNRDKARYLSEIVGFNQFSNFSLYAGNLKPRIHFGTLNAITVCKLPPKIEVKFLDEGMINLASQKNINRQAASETTDKSTILDALRM